MHVETRRYGYSEDVPNGLYPLFRHPVRVKDPPGKKPLVADDGAKAKPPAYDETGVQELVVDDGRGAVSLVLDY